MTSPADAIIAVTYRCNARCVMCNVWKSREADTLAPEHMRKLPAGLKTINFSGGEPFLRDDLPEFVREARARCPGAQITLSTNAMLSQRIAESMADLRRIDPTVRLAVSLDGIGGAHDRIRGREGTFQAVTDLIDRLTADGFKGLRLSMTLSEGNLDQLVGVAALAAERGLELGIVAAHGSRTHLGLDEPPAVGMPAWLVEPFRKMIATWLRSWRPKLWLRGHFALNTYRYLAGRPCRFRCRAGRDFFFLQADGTVYSCSVQGKAMGNIATQTWEQIWRGAAAAETHRFVRTCPESCWMICTARSVYRARPGAAIWWILTRKPAAHLGLLRLPTVPVDAAGTGEGES